MKFFNRTSTKIALGIILITSIVLTYISFLAVSTAQNEFTAAAGRIVSNGDVVFQTVPVVAVTNPINNIKNDFNDKLNKTLFFAGLLGIGMSIAAGLIFSEVITRPLKKLRDGISDLKKNKYKSQVELTGEEEFDEVIDEFNGLIKQLDYQENLRKDLISDVSHELKTPITSLLGQIQGMKDKVLEIDEKRLGILLNDVERLNHLVLRLNEYTSLRSKTPELKLDEVKLKSVVDYVKDSFSINLKKANIKFISKVSSQTVLKADKEILERIMKNIIDNAIKYSKAKSIRVEFVNNEIIISDNGIGIPESDLEKIFERFYRVDKSRSRKTGGLGLGLSLVREMVEAHGWNIKAENNKKGMSFIIHLGA